jgi:hypothetical protein
MEMFQYVLQSYLFMYCSFVLKKSDVINALNKSVVRINKCDYKQFQFMYSDCDLLGYDTV